MPLICYYKSSTNSYSNISSIIKRKHHFAYNQLIGARRRRSNNACIRGASRRSLSYSITAAPRHSRVCTVRYGTVTYDTVRYGRAFDLLLLLSTVRYRYGKFLYFHSFKVGYGTCKAYRTSVWVRDNFLRC
jgi:hypothetical protein